MFNFGRLLLFTLAYTHQRMPLLCYLGVFIFPFWLNVAAVEIFSNDLKKLNHMHSWFSPLILTSEPAMWDCAHTDGTTGRASVCSTNSDVQEEMRWPWMKRLIYTQPWENISKLHTVNWPFIHTVITIILTICSHSLSTHAYSLRALSSLLLI